MIPLIFALATLVGGSNSALVKFTVSQFPPIIFVALRALIAFIIISPFVLKTTHQSLEKKVLLLLVVNLVFAANWLIFAIGIQHTSVIISQLIYVPTSLTVAIIGFLMFKDRLTKNQIWGLALTLSGALILTLGSVRDQGITFGTPFGNFMVTAGMFCWAFYLILSGKISKIYSPLTIIFYNFVVSFILGSALFLLDPNSRNFTFGDIDQTGFLGLAYVGIFSSAIYFYLNQWLIKHTSAFVSSLQIYPVTLIASALGVIFYDERLTTNLIIAAMMIMLGVFIATSYNFLRNKLNLWT